MQSTRLKFWMAAASTALIFSPASALAADQLRDVPAFTSISSQGVFQVTVNVGQKQSVALSGSERMLAKIETKVEDGVLMVTMPEHKNFQNDEKMAQITINVEQLNQFQMEGAGKTELNNIAAERFRLNFQGVGLLRATGKVQTLVLKAEGVGSVNARDLEAQHVDVNVQGVGAVQIRAKESLRAKVEGIGSLTYYGRPAHISKTMDGIGSISAGD